MSQFNVLYTHASVRVMRSHDYCHFEVVLGYADSPGVVVTEETVDNVRKAAARLVDKAVEQYKIKKENLSRMESASSMANYAREQAKEIEAKAETDRTPEEQAILKRYKDALFEATRAYDYQDDWDD